jgi:hypothetical protein
LKRRLPHPSRPVRTSLALSLPRVAKREHHAILFLIRPSLCVNTVGKCPTDLNHYSGTTASTFSPVTIASPSCDAVESYCFLNISHKYGNMG